MDDWNLDIAHLLRGVSARDGRPFISAADSEVVKLSEWCGKIGSPDIKHCLLLVELKRTIAPGWEHPYFPLHSLLMLEQEGGANDWAYFTATFINEPEGMVVREIDWNNAEQVRNLGEYLRRNSAMSHMQRGTMDIHRMHVPPAAGPINAHKKGIGYRHATDLTFPRQDNSQTISLETLRKLTVDYANLRPKYSSLRENCQMYSTTIYNILTNTDQMRYNGILASIGALLTSPIRLAKKVFAPGAESRNVNQVAIR